MAVNQAQVDHIISSASADDPEVKLLKLQDEVELIKTSIKRLLIDIRERMNDMENPIMIGGGQSAPGEVSVSVASALRDTSTAVQAAAGAVRATSELAQKEGQTQDPPAPVGVSQAPAAGPGTAGQTTAAVFPQASAQPPQGDIDFLSALKSQIASLPGEDTTMKAALGDKVRLQKVFRLFEWTSRNVKRFGHDRTDLMLDAYHAMGYISDKSCKLVKDMTRLMPSSLGEVHDIRADEFVSELYELNHILNPSDSTLDRDMIEVLMEKREGKETQKLLGPAHPSDEEIPKEYLPSRDRV
jgi:hypothetical protein